MKRLISFAGIIIGIIIFFEGCSSSKQQNNEETTLKEKETFTFDEIKSDSSAPLPIDSVALANESDEIKKAEIPAVKTRKKSMDNQESPVPAAANKRNNAVSDTLPKAGIKEIAELPEKTDSRENLSSGQYIVQLGAFQSVDNAKEFIKLNKLKIKQEMSIHFSEKVKLYQVHLRPLESKIKAQNLVKELKKKGYKDVFVVLPVN